MLAIYTLPMGLLVSGPIVGAVGFRGLAVLFVGLGLTLSASIALVPMPWYDGGGGQRASATATASRQRAAGARSWWLKRSAV
jgi:hypothetical protein